MKNLECVVDGMGCGACCSNARLPLNSEERDRLERAGSTLVEVLPITIGVDPVSLDPYPYSWSDMVGSLEESVVNAPTEAKREFWQAVVKRARAMTPGQGLYTIDGACGNLGNNGVCTDYENRPKACAAEPTGGEACIQVRSEQRPDLPIPITLTQKPIRIG